MSGGKHIDEKRREQELAWIGDTVLDLYSRSWILENHGTVSGEMQQRMTSNQFLACIGNPTSVEAEIGTIYQRDGLEAAFQWIEEHLLPLFKKQDRNRQ